MLTLSHEIVTVRTKHPFVIARGGSSEWRVVWIRVRDADGVEGWGEAAPSRYYGESPESVVAALDRLAPVVERADAWSLEALEREMHRTLRFNGAAKSGISAAVHDLVGKRLGAPLHRIWGLDPAAAPRSSFTLAIAADERELCARLAEAAPYPVLKVKLGSAWDRRIMEIVRETYPD